MIDIWGATLPNSTARRARMGEAQLKEDHLISAPVVGARAEAGIEVLANTLDTFGYVPSIWGHDDI